MRIRVGDWVVDPEDLSLRRGETVRRLEPKVMTLLVRLAESRGEVVRREALFAALWPDVTVGEDTLARVVSKLRRALGDDPKRPVFVETIPTRGYRLIAEVGTELPPGPPAATSAGASTSVRTRRPALVLAGAVVIGTLAGAGWAGWDWGPAVPTSSATSLARADDLYMRFRRADNEAALALYEAAVRSRPENAAALSGAANALVQRVVRWPGRPGEPDRGALSISEALAAGLHQSPAARAELARARGFAETAVELEPASGRTRKALGLVLAASGEIEAAEVQYRLAIEADPRAYAPHINLGELRVLADDLEGGLEHFERAFALMLDAYPTEPQRVGQWPAELGVAIGQLHERLGAPRQAQQWYERVVALVPLHPGATGRLAASWARLGQPERAKALCAELASKVEVSEPCQSLLTRP